MTFGRFARTPKDGPFAVDRVFAVPDWLASLAVAVGQE